MRRTSHWYCVSDIVTVTSNACLISTWLIVSLRRVSYTYDNQKIRTMHALGYLLNRNFVLKALESYMSYSADSDINSRQYDLVINIDGYMLQCIWF